jgi:nicotinate-nucleotide pyrophosphorylase (carboxylating)
MRAPDLKKLVEMALNEDIGSGDVTTAMFAGQKRKARAFFLAKASGRMTGGRVVKEVFRHLDPRCRFTQLVADGDDFVRGRHLIEVQADLCALLQGERTALNFLQHLCGVATLTREYVRALGKAAERIGIYDTRKTTPLLRALEKKAVADGGGRNHRFGLFDMVLIKNNHIDAAGGVAQAMRALLEQGRSLRKGLTVCIEARDADEALEALAVGADIIMLDNMAVDAIRQVVARLRQRARQLDMPMPEIEISGGVTPEDVRMLRRLPIQRISVGRITHSAPALDISMRIDIDAC